MSTSPSWRMADQLGSRLRTLRQERRYSLAQVAAGAELSTSFLSLVENGRSDITISRLVRLLNFYKVGISDLLSDSGSRDEIVVRKEDTLDLYSSSEGIAMFLLAPDGRRAMMPILCEFDPEGHSAEFSKHEGEEFVHVLKGSIELQVEGSELVVLEPGDSAYFQARRPHSYRNVGGGTARVIAVVTPPGL